MFQCCECNHLFKTVRGAERAANKGCPKCGSVDINIAAHQESVRLRDDEELIRYGEITSSSVRGTVVTYGRRN